jgi:hypothetical protein
MQDGGLDNEFKIHYKTGAVKCFTHKYAMLCIHQSLFAVRTISL